MRSHILPILILALSGCAAHSTIAPGVLEKGESVRAVTFSGETGIPVMSWRSGIGDRTDLGLHLGLPLYGTGVDLGYALKRDKDGSGDILNTGVFLMPNTNIDLTYYKIRTTGWILPGSHPYFGWRFMIIPRGIQKQSSLRFGFLFGWAVPGRFGVELGYFHDFIEGERFYDKTQFPSEKHPLTGVSLRFALFSS